MCTLKIWHLDNQLIEVWMCEGLLYQVVHTELMYLPHMNHDLISSGANDFTSCKTLFWTEHCFESTLSRFFFYKILINASLVRV